MKIIGIIPARFGSTRFPGKPLAMIHGKSMIQRVVEQAQKASSLYYLMVATDDQRIYDHVKEFGGNVVMTHADHPSGTDRCLQAFEKTCFGADAVINIQGDEPFVSPLQIDALAELIAKPEVEIATLVKRIHDAETLFDPNRVKVVFDNQGKALYFSRHAIPYQKNQPQENWLLHHHYFKHIGIYAYKSKILQDISEIHPTTLEMAESLEQLRWLQCGKSIYVAQTDIETPTVDTPEDLEKLLSGL